LKNAMSEKAGRGEHSSFLTRNDFKPTSLKFSPLKKEKKVGALGTAEEKGHRHPSFPGGERRGKRTTLVFPIVKKKKYDLEAAVLGGGKGWR